LVVILIMEERQMNKSHSYPFTSLGCSPDGGNHELAEQGVSVGINFPPSPDIHLT
jgi:hypothetical protein